MPKKKQEEKPKKSHCYYAVTEAEYDANPGKYKDKDNVVIFVDDADRRAFIGDGPSCEAWMNDLDL